MMKARSLLNCVFCAFVLTLQTVAFAEPFEIAPFSIAGVKLHMHRRVVDKTQRDEGRYPSTWSGVVYYGESPYGQGENRGPLVWYDQSDRVVAAIGVVLKIDGHSILERGHDITRVVRVLGNPDRRIINGCFEDLIYERWALTVEVDPRNNHVLEFRFNRPTTAKE